MSSTRIILRLNEVQFFTNTRTMRIDLTNKLLQKTMTLIIKLLSPPVHMEYNLFNRGVVKMRRCFTIIRAIINTVLITYLTSCSTSETDDTITAREELSELLVYPQLYVGKDTVLEGTVKSVEIRSATKGITIIIVKLSPIGEQKNSGQNAVYNGDRFAFLSKLQQANEVFDHIKSIDTSLQQSSYSDIKDIGYQFKVASQELNALGYFLKQHGKAETSQALFKIAQAYSLTAESYFLFADIGEKTSTSETAPPSAFENKLYTTALLLNDVAENIIKSKFTILKGLHSFEYEKEFLPDTSYKILTHSSSLSAQSWFEIKIGNKRQHQALKSLAHAFKEFGKANRLINEGISDLGKALSKTAVRWTHTKDPALRCAYFGYNGSHLVRCAQLLNSLNGSKTPVRIRGKLVRSDLREEVNVVWFQAEGFEVDGLTLSFSYGDKNGAMKSTVEIYEWVEDVQKGGE